MIDNTRTDSRQIVCHSRLGYIVIEVITTADFWMLLVKLQLPISHRPCHGVMQCRKWAGG